jgi:hypothetical protein
MIMLLLTISGFLLDRRMYIPREVGSVNNYLAFILDTPVVR